jgi:hypothetical protein
VDLEDFMITVYCLVDALRGTGCRSRLAPHPAARSGPVLDDTDVLTMEAVGEFLS